MLLFLILCGVCLGYLGLGPKPNLVVAIVLIILGAIVTLAGGDLTVRVD